jgi:hypothetical protein
MFVASVFTGGIAWNWTMAIDFRSTASIPLKENQNLHRYLAASSATSLLSVELLEIYLDPFVVSVCE